MKALVSLFLVLFSTNVFAECGDKCAFGDTDDEGLVCESLGYKQGVVCPEGHITCPFDSSYIWCKEYTCADGGFLTERDMVAQKSQGYDCPKISYHGLDCYDCNECMVNKSVCKYEKQSADRGNFLGACCDGSYKQCIEGEILSVAVPQNAIGVEETVLNCGKEEKVVLGFDCVSSYQKNSEGTACIPQECSTPTIYPEILYTTTDKTCEGEGYFLEQAEFVGSKVCSRCRPRDCDVGYTAGLTACETESAYIYTTKGYSGDKICGKCEKKELYVNDITECPSPLTPIEGWSAEKGWNLVSDGDSFYCDPKSCSGEYSEQIQSVADCPSSAGYIFAFDPAHFYGEKMCGKCLVKESCSEGSLDLEVSSCGYPSLVGASAESTGDYVGLKPCQRCACNATSDICPYGNRDDQALVGSKGQGKTLCCDGVSYEDCSLQQTYVDNGYVLGECDVVPHIAENGCEDFEACGNTYFKITECEEGFEISGTNDSCVEVSCDDSPSTCPYANGDFEGRTDIGAGGVGSDLCCEGTFYEHCSLKNEYSDYVSGQCEGKSHVAENGCAEIEACGSTYYKITNCESGYEVSGGGSACTESEVEPETYEGCGISFDLSYFASTVSNYLFDTRITQNNTLSSCSICDDISTTKDRRQCKENCSSLLNDLCSQCTFDTQSKCRNPRGNLPYPGILCPVLEGTTPSDTCYQSISCDTSNNWYDATANCPDGMTPKSSGLLSRGPCRQCEVADTCPAGQVLSLIQISGLTPAGESSLGHYCYALDACYNTTYSSLIECSGHTTTISSGTGVGGSQTQTQTLMFGDLTKCEACNNNGEIGYQLACDTLATTTPCSEEVCCQITLNLPSDWYDCIRVHNERYCATHVAVPPFETLVRPNYTHVNVGQDDCYYCQKPSGCVEEITDSESAILFCGSSGASCSTYGYEDGPCSSATYSPLCQHCTNHTTYGGQECHEITDRRCEDLTCYNIFTSLLDEDHTAPSCGLIKYNAGSGLHGGGFLITDGYASGAAVDLESYDASKHNSNSYTETEWTVYSGNSNQSEVCPYSCYRYVADDTCPTGQSKSCSCESTLGDKTAAGTQCYYCTSSGTTPAAKTACDNSCPYGECTLSSCGYTCECTVAEYDRLVQKNTIAAHAILSCSGSMCGTSNPSSVYPCTQFYGAYTSCGIPQTVANSTGDSLSTKQEKCRQNIATYLSDIDTWNSKCSTKISKSSGYCHYCIYSTSASLALCHDDGTLSDELTNPLNPFQPVQP